MARAPKVLGVETDVGSADKLKAAAGCVRLPRDVSPQIGLVLGSGLGGFADTLVETETTAYADIAYMPVPRVAGHAGHLHIGRIGDARVACLAGRVHRYEGYALEQVTFGVRLLAELGCHTVLLTNAAGGIRDTFSPGDLMLIEDHINFTGENPLRGPNDSSGPRFPDMTHAYDARLRELALDVAEARGVALEQGVYVGVTGPSYETPAEVRMLRTLGADAVGMSTVFEVIAMRHRGVRVGAVSCITNLAAGLTPARLTHDEVARTAEQARSRLATLLNGWVEKIAEDEG